MIRTFMNIHENISEVNEFLLIRGSCFETIHEVSASQLEVSFEEKTYCFVYLSNWCCV